MTDVEQVLAGVPLFRGLDPKQIRSLSKFTTTRTYQPGQVLVQEGQPSYGLFCLESGEVRVTQNMPTGVREIRTMGAGESFGEIALIDDQPRSATVTAVEPTTAIILDKMQFSSEVHNNPDVAMPLMRTLVQLLRDQDRRIADLT